MKPGKIVATLSLLGSLAALIPSVVAADNYDIGSAARNAATRSDHEAVAKYYEDVAREMQAKVQEKKELLEQYENKSYLYGRQAGSGSESPCRRAGKQVRETGESPSARGCSASANGFATSGKGAFAIRFTTA